MPFRKKCRITLENIADEGNDAVLSDRLYFTEVPSDAAYFHAQFRRTNPLPNQTDYVLTDGIKGKGHYVGTYMAWGSNNNGWWGEGEIKFFMDGDDKYPTICALVPKIIFAALITSIRKKRMRLVLKHPSSRSSLHRIPDCIR
jgi:hypothetical protein